MLWTVQCIAMTVTDAPFSSAPTASPAAAASAAVVKWTAAKVFITLGVFILAGIAGTLVLLPAHAALTAGHHASTLALTPQRLGLCNDTAKALVGKCEKEVSRQ